MCRKYVIEEENPFHVLFECKALTDLRQKHLTQGYQMILPSEKLSSGRCCSCVRAQVFCELLSVVREQLANKSVQWFLAVGVTTQGVIIISWLFVCDRSSSGSGHADSQEPAVHESLAESGTLSR